MLWIRRLIPTLVCGLAVAALCATLPAQTLAHRNWVGSGITVAPWWKGAEFYLVDPLSFQDADGDGLGDLAGIVARLDYLEGLGVDAVVLSPFSPGAGGAVFDPAYGSEEDFERLVAEATQRHLRVVVDLALDSSAAQPGLHPPRRQAELLSEARFWLIRGVAGLRLTGASADPAREETLRALRRLCGSFAGQRVLLLAPPATRLPMAPIAASAAREGSTHGGAQEDHGEAAEAPLLGVDERSSLLHALTPADLRLLLAADGAPAGRATLAATDSSERPRSFTRMAAAAADGEAQARSLARVLAAALLLGAHAPLLLFGQEVGMASDSAADPAPMQWGGNLGFTSGVPWIEMGPNAASANVEREDGDAGSLLNWYRRLGALRHRNAAVRNGSLTLVSTTNPDAVAWVRRAQAGAAAAPVVVVVNLSPRAATISLSLAGDLSGSLAGYRGLHTLASTYGAGVTVQPRSIALPAYGVYVGEVRAQPGLETVVLPPRSRSRPRPRPHSP